MPPTPPPKGPKNPAPPARPAPAPGRPPVRHLPGMPPLAPLPASAGEMPLGVAVSAESSSGTVTARKAGGLRDMSMDVNPGNVGVAAALQHMAKSVNIAFQTDYGENFLESVYQAAVVRRGVIVIVHREYFGFGDSWFGQFGRLLRSMQLTLNGPDPASPEGQRRIAEKGPSTIRGLLNLMARKLDLVAEFEDRVPAYVEQMFDRLEASGIIVGWDRGQWEITTTRVGLDIVISPREAELGDP